jgi:hypothetical protein
MLRDGKCELTVTASGAPKFAECTTVFDAVLDVSGGEILSGQDGQDFCTPGEVRIDPSKYGRPEDEHQASWFGRSRNIRIASALYTINCICRTGPFDHQGTKFYQQQRAYKQL